jgi:hypothetical protein
MYTPIVLDTEGAESLECTICYELATQPVTCTACVTNIGCADCVKKVQEANPKCPWCRANWSDFTINSSLQQKVEELESKCCFNECSFEDTYATVQNHILQCDYRLVACEGCKHELVHSILPQHREECIVDCENKEIGCTWRGKLLEREAHGNECALKKAKDIIATHTATIDKMKKNNNEFIKACVELGLVVSLDVFRILVQGRSVDHLIDTARPRPAAPVVRRAAPVARRSAPVTDANESNSIPRKNENKKRVRLVMLCTLSFGVGCLATYFATRQLLHAEPPPPMNIPEPSLRDSISKLANGTYCFSY